MFEVTGPPLMTGGSFGLEGGLIVTISTLAMILVVLVLRMMRKGAQES